MEQISSTVPPSGSKGKEIAAESQEITLADITQSDSGKAIHVRVYRKWTPTNKQARPVLFCCMLIDRQVTKTIL